MGSEKPLDMLSDHLSIFLQSKVPAIEQVQFKSLEIALKGIGSLWAEKRIIFAPDHERRRLMLAKVGMPFRIEPQVRWIVVQQFQLDEIIAWTIQEGLIHRPGVGTDRFWVTCSMPVLEDGGLAF
jgi:hypothetical protein